MNFPRNINYNKFKNFFLKSSRAFNPGYISVVSINRTYRLLILSRPIHNLRVLTLQYCDEGINRDLLMKHPKFEGYPGAFNYHNENFS